MQMLRGRTDNFNVNYYKLTPLSTPLSPGYSPYLPPHGASASARFLFAFGVGAAQRQQAENEYVT